MNKTNNNNIILSHSGELERGYIAPSIEVIKDVYNEGLMTTISLGVSTTPATGGGDAKPDGDWGDIWAQPETNDDNWGV